MKKTAFLIAFVAALVSSGNTPSYSSPIACGATISKNTTLHADITNCPADGLHVVADNITLNLNGHLISHVATLGSIGIVVSAHRGVTITNGRVKGFTFGVNLDTSTLSTVSKIRGIKNGHGVRLYNSHGDVVKANTITGGDNGLLITGGSHDNTLTGNKLSGGNSSGIRLNGSTSNLVKGNTISGYGNRGINLIGGANDNDVINNVSIKNTADAIGVEDSNNNLIDRNSVGRSGVGVNLLGTSASNKVTGNTSNTNLGQGINVLSTVTATLLDRNVANDNGGNGFDVAATDVATVISNNTANGNTGAGIQAATGVTDGNGNAASGNGGIQCSANISCA